MLDRKPILILPTWLITSAREVPKKNWGVRVLGNQITHVAPHDRLIKEYPDAEHFQAPGQVLSPGFVNTHTHMYGILAHGIPLQNAPADFWGFLDDFWWPLIENRLDSVMINAATALRCMHLIQSGVTTFYDCIEAPNALPGCLQSQSEVVQHFGLRANLSFEATQRMGLENGKKGLEENVSFINYCKRKQKEDAGYLINGLMCHHTLFTCSKDFVRQAFELAEENDVLLHAHVSEGLYEPSFSIKEYGKRTIEEYKELGITGSRFLASQCVQIDDHEVEIIANSGVRVAHMPLSNCEVGGGIAPVPQLLAKQVTLGLGSDGYIDDFFEIMRGAFLIHKAAHLDPGVMPAREVWYLATEGGARTLGLEKIGKVQTGWIADLQLIDGNLPTPLEAHNFFDQLLLYRNSSHVKSVMVNGQFIMKNSVIPDLDAEKLTADVHQEAKRLWSYTAK